MGGLIITELVKALTQLLAKKSLDANTYRRLFELLEKAGVKPGPKTQEAQKQLMESADSQSGEGSQTIEVPEEVAEELADTLSGFVRTDVMPVYMEGVVFLAACDFTEEEKTYLHEILENINDEDNGLEYKNEGDRKNQEIVDEFMREYREGFLDPADYAIEKNMIILYFEYDQHLLYTAEREYEMRELADALNCLMRDKNIVSFYLV